MNKVLVKQFGGGVVGEVSQSLEGEVVVKGNTPEMETELSLIVQALSLKPLIIYTSLVTETDGEIVEKTVATECEPGHPLYLRALADALSSCGSKVGGKRIRGIYEGDISK